MPLPSDQLPPDQGYLLQRLADMQRQIDEMRAARSAEATTIGRAGLKVVDGTGQERLFMGHTASFEGVDQPVFFLRDAAGRLRLALYDPKPSSDGYQPVVWVYDHTGRVAFTTDINGGVAEPWIPVIGQNTAWPSTFLDIGTTYLTLPVSACTGVVAWEGWIGKVSHPKISYGGVFGRATGVSGTPTYTLKVNGTTVDSFSQTTISSDVRGPFDISSLLGVSTVTVQLSVSATGTGTDRIAAHIKHCYLRQT